MTFLLGVLVIIALTLLVIALLRVIMARRIQRANVLQVEGSWRGTTTAGGFPGNSGRIQAQDRKGSLSFDSGRDG